MCGLLEGTEYSRIYGNIIQCIKWLGHVQRMKEGRESKRALDGRPGGRRSKGRPHSSMTESRTI